MDSLNSFRSIFILYLALLIGQFLFCMLLLFLLSQPDNDVLDSQSSVYPYLAPLIILAAGGAASFMDKFRRQSLPLNANLSSKITHYRVSVIIRAALVEGGNLFCLMLAILENSLMPILYFAIGLLVFLYFRPRISEFADLYRISDAERTQLEAQLKRKQ